jgi:hypothetical protein
MLLVDIYPVLVNKTVQKKISDAQGERAHQLLTRMLSACSSSLRVCSACFEGTFKNLEFLHLC